MKFSEITKQIADEALLNDRVFSSLIKDNDMFFEKIINFSKTQKHFPDHLEKDDIKQELYISFFKALKKFKSENNCKFSTFAWTVLKNDLIVLKNKNFKIILNEFKPEYSDNKISTKTKTKLNGDSLHNLIDSNNAIDNLMIKQKSKFFNLEKEVIQKITFDESISKIDSLNRKIMELKIRKIKMKDIAKKLNLNQHTLKWIYTTSTLPLYKKALKDSIII